MRIYRALYRILIPVRGRARANVIVNIPAIETIAARAPYKEI